MKLAIVLIILNIILYMMMGPEEVIAFCAAMFIFVLTLKTLSWLIINYDIRELKEKYLVMVLGGMAIIAGIVMLGIIAIFDIECMMGKYKTVSAEYLYDTDSEIEVADGELHVYYMVYSYYDNGTKTFKGKMRFIPHHKKYREKVIIYRNVKTGKLKESPKDLAFFGVSFISVGAVAVFWKYRQRYR